MAFGLAAVLLGIALSACATLVDEGRAHVCRTVVPAIEAGNAQIAILRSSAGSDADTVRVDYRVTLGGSSAFRHIVCRFVPDERDAGPGVLSKVDTPKGPLNETQLLFLRRFYLELPGEAPPDPGYSAASASLILPPSVALGLQQLIAALPSAAIYGLLAASYALIQGLVGRVVFGFGDLAALGGYAALTGLSLGMATGPLAALALGLTLALIVSSAYGAAAGRFAVLPTLRSRGQAVVIATVGLMMALSEYARLTMPRDMIWAPPLLSSPLAIARAEHFVVTVTPMQLLSAATGIVGALCLLSYQRWSRFGRAWRAVSQDELAAAMLGIDRDRILTKSFAIAASLAGLAGYVLTVHFGQAGYAYGFTLGLKALVGAVLGGIGSVGAAFTGGLILAFGEAAWSALFSVDSRDLAVYSLLAILFIFRPYGIFGQRPEQPDLN